MVDEACGRRPDKPMPATGPLDPDAIAYTLYPGPSPLLHREGLPGLTPCMLPFSDLFGAVAMAHGHADDAPLCVVCFPADDENRNTVRDGEAQRG